MTLTDQDLKRIEQLFEPRFLAIGRSFQAVDERFKGLEEEFRGVGQNISKKIDNLTKSVDKFMADTNRHDDELTVIRVQQKRVRDVLVQKGVASESELSITG